MHLSKESIKNLLDLLQKISLAITTISIALISNLILSHPNVEKEAARELPDLLTIREELGLLTPQTVFGLQDLHIKNLSKSDLREAFYNVYKYKIIVITQTESHTERTFRLYYPQFEPIPSSYHPDFEKLTSFLRINEV